MYKIIITTLLCLLISACQIHKKRIITHESSNWNSIKSWSFNGKMAINDGNNNGSGKIYWQIVKKDTTKAQFKAPLGQGSWTITETSHSAKLESSRNGEITGDNASILINNELGWDFPWNSLKYWVRGYKTNQFLYPHSNLPKIINDNNWTITYQKWMNTPIGMLPKKIKATKDHYSVKLIIYQWNIKLHESS